MRPCTKGDEVAIKNYREECEVNFKVVKTGSLVILKGDALIKVIDLWSRFPFFGGKFCKFSLSSERGPSQYLFSLLECVFSSSNTIQGMLP